MAGIGYETYGNLWRAVAAAVPLLVGVTSAVSAASASSPAAPPPSASHPCGALASPPAYTHVIWVWMENHSYDTIIGSSQAPYINSLAAGCGLASNLPVIFNSPQYRDGSTAVFLTWDEGEGGTALNCATNTTDVGCHVATIVISPSTVPGTTSATLFNHYSLLGTTEQLLGLPELGLASSFPTMAAAFHL
jgi:hypothetical protein